MKVKCELFHIKLHKRSTCLLQKVYYYQTILLLQEVNYKKQGRKKTI